MVVGHSIPSNDIRAYCDGHYIVVNSGIGTGTHSFLFIEKGDYVFKESFANSNTASVEKEQITPLSLSDLSSDSDIHPQTFYGLEDI